MARRRGAPRLLLAVPAEEEDVDETPREKALLDVERVVVDVTVAVAVVGRPSVRVGANILVVDDDNVEEEAWMLLADEDVGWKRDALEKGSLSLDLEGLV